MIIILISIPISKRMESILAALKQEQERQQSGLVAILGASSTTPNVTVHTYLEEEEDILQKPLPPGGNHSGTQYPKIYDHNGQILQVS